MKEGSYITQRSAQRVGIFIDTQNLYHSAKSLYDKRVNFEELVKTVSENRNLVRAIAYVISTEEKDEAPFFEALANIGIDIKTKTYKYFLVEQKKLIGMSGWPLMQ